MGDLPNIKNLRLPFGVTLPEVNSLAFEFNHHMLSHESIEEFFEGGFFEIEWISAEERTRAIETNQVWCAHWYDKTPSGSYVILGSTLEAVIKYFGEIAHG